MTTTHTTNTTSSPARTNATTPPRTLSDFPRNVLGEIAYHLVVDDQGVGQHPSALLPLMLTCRTIHDAISFDDHPALYNRLFRATFDHAALTRRYLWMKAHMANTAGRGQKTFDLFADPRAWATDYKTRWEQSWRMRQVVKHAKIEVPGICDKEQLTADLWNVWFLLTENGACAALHYTIYHLVTRQTYSQSKPRSPLQTARTSTSLPSNVTSRPGSWCTTKRTCSRTRSFPAIRRRAATRPWGSGVHSCPARVS
jgi:hypothetical protein